MITSLQWLDELKLSLSYVTISKDWNDPLLMTYINKARREVQRLTMRLYPERYGDKMQKFINSASTVDANSQVYSYAQKPITVYNIQLDNNVIDIYAVVCSWTIGTQTQRVPTRKTSREELFEISMNAINTPRASSPVYAFETVNNVKIFSITGFNVSPTMKLFDITVGNKIYQDIYYIRALDDLEIFNGVGADIDTVIPEFLEGLTTQFASFYCLEEAGGLEVKDAIEFNIKNQLSDLGIQYEIKAEKQENLLPEKEVK